MKKSFIAALAVVLMAACTTPLHHPQYTSVDEYPVKDGSLDEVAYSPKSTTFSVWAPAADSVLLSLYERGDQGEAFRTEQMHLKKDGSWTTKVKGNLCGSFYTFRIFQNGEWMQETPGIFAKAVGVNGRRAAIIDMATTNPEGWAADVRPAFGEIKDAVIYEMHWRDFTQHATAGVEHHGKFLSMTESGTLSPDGLSTGIDHLRELGITHVHILPSYDFGSIDESGAASEARVLESGAAVGGQYNWGYDPVNYNVPEGSYSTDPFTPEVRIREFKQMVQAMHAAGIRVILDVVYNHTYNVDGSAFHLTAPGYFYRYTEDGELSNASGCGNETASNRPMMRKYMIESVLYWMNEYHLDGFRFDLMGIHDIETMNAIRKATAKVDPTILIYGEGWAAGAPQYPSELLAIKANVPQMPGIAAFSDDMRDGLRGPFSDDHQGAFLAGLPGLEQSICFGLVGSIEHPDVDMTKVNYSKAPFAAQPSQTIAYVSCHDDMCLVDRLKASVTRDPAELTRLDLLAQTAVLTSQGIPFIFCGEEVMRDKKGVHNSFCSPDSINAIDWSLKQTHLDAFLYYKGLIALRRQHPAFRMGDAKLVQEHMHFLPVEGTNLIAFVLDGAAVGDEWGTIVVVLNARKEVAQVALPTGDYTSVVEEGTVDTNGINTYAVAEEEPLSVAPQSAMILYL